MDLRNHTTIPANCLWIPAAILCIFPPMTTGETAATEAEKFLKHTRVQVLVSQRLRIGSEWTFDLCSPFWRIYVNDRAGASLHHAGRRLPLGGGVPWIIPAWMRFQTSSQRPVVQDFIHFQVSGLVSRSLERTLKSPLGIPGDPSLAAVVARWREGIGTNDFSSFSWAAAAAHAALAAALEGWPVTEQQAEWRSLSEHAEIQPALDIIAARPGSPPSNRELARRCGISEDHFIRKFRRATGSTPAGYGREHRISLAAEWLIGTRRTLDDIAEAAGFSDRFHFSRAFAARLGCPPARYRRSHQLVANPVPSPATSPRR